VPPCPPSGRRHQPRAAQDQHRGAKQCHGRHDGRHNDPQPPDQGLPDTHLGRAIRKGRDDRMDPVADNEFFTSQDAGAKKGKKLQPNKS